MIKNLKKVISAVAALAISASAVSAFAVNFPDVAEDASYAQAVQELSSLDIISGFDDGTFRPDELVTRAQISKMVVDALNERAQAEASKANTKFADVSTDHWAKGYINQGVADGFISGYSDTEFGPDDNVTYVQAQKMLVSAIGYDTFAQGNGGWPNGYKQWAATTGITSGMSGLTDDTQLTRAQVAQMIDNAMDAPVCVIKDWTTQWNGVQTPNLEVKDGEGKDYQTLFTKRHNAYKVYGRVTDTNKTNSSIDNDKVDFRVEKADNFDDQYVKANNNDEITETMYYGDTNAEDMVRTYAQALIQKDDDDEFHILSIAPAAASKTVVLFSEDYDDSKSDLSKNVLYFYPAGTTRSAVKYELADSVDYYVNGVSMGTFDEDALKTYIEDNDTTIVTLQKETKSGSTSTDSKYNVIMITSYGTAVVDQIVTKTDEIKINFKEQSTGLKTSMTVETDEDTDKRYTFTDKDGNAVDPAELAEDTVLTISYDEEAGFADSNFYDVFVSTDTAEGKYTGKNSDSTEFTIGGTKYKAAYGMDIVSQLETSNEYTLYLDAFGRIAYVDEEAATKKLGILKRVYQKSNGDYIAEVITKEGKIEEYNVDDADAEDYMDLVTSTKQADVLTAYPQQVIDYKVSSTDKLTIKKTYTATAVTSEYKESSNKIGSIKLSDSSVIIDISNAADKKDDISVISASSLKDGTTYTAYGYDKSNSDSTSRFVIITEGIGGIDSTSQLAVFLESGTDTNAEGDDVDTMTVIYDGEQVTYEIDDDSSVDVSDFEEGDLVVFSRNSAGEVDNLISIFDEYGVVNSTDYAGFRNDVFAGNIGLTAGLDAELTDGDEDVNVYFGAVVNRSGNTYTIAPVIDGDHVDLDAGPDITISSDTKIYTYNFDGKKKNFGRITTDDGMQVTPDVKNAYEGADKASDIYYLDNPDVVDSVVFAVVRTFDEDEAQEVYLVVAD